MNTPRLLLVGDHDTTIPAHQAIPLAVALAAADGRQIDAHWVATDELARTPARLHEADGLWLVPGSPYRDTAAALLACHQARRSGTPFLGTCGGFQHALIEFARNVAGVADAEHEETAPEANQRLITRLSCSLVEKRGRVHTAPGTLVDRLLARWTEPVGYRCNYGLDAAYRAPLERHGLRFSAFDDAGNVRAFELPTHPFYLGTLFQPERDALAGKLNPIVAGFFDACVRHGAGR